MDQVDALETTQGNILKLISNSEKYSKETSHFFKHNHEILRSGSLPNGIHAQKSTSVPDDSINQIPRKTTSKAVLPVGNKLANLHEVNEPPKILSNRTNFNVLKKNMLKNCNIAINIVNKDLCSLNTQAIEKKTLQFLNISSNKFRRFPEELKEFINLKSLKIDHNFIKTLPNWLISTFPSLEILSISDNLIQDLSFMDSKEEVNKHLQKSLKFFDVSCNHIDFLPSSLQNFRELNCLRVHNNDFLKIPTSLKNLEKLQEFTLDWFKYIKKDDNKINEAVFSSLKQRFSPYFTLNLEGFNDLINEGKASKLYTLVFCYFLRKCEKEEEKNFIFFLDLMNFFYQGSGFTMEINQILPEKGQSLMHKAVMNEEIGVIKSLIFFEFEHLDLIDSNNHSALSLAIYEERYFAAKVLIYNGANVEIGGNVMGSCLNIAIIKMQTFLIEDLLKFGADPNGKDTDGNTPLHYISSIYSKDVEKSSKIISKLLEYGADPNSKNIDLWSPIHLAVKKEQIEALNFMFSWNKQLNSSSKNQMAVIENKEKKIEKRPFKISKKGGNDKWTPLHIAVSIANFNIINLLLENKADIYAVNIANKKPIFYCRSVGILKLLRIHERKILSSLRGQSSGNLKLSFMQSFIMKYDKNSDDVDEERSKIMDTIYDIEEVKTIKNLVLASNDINKLEKFHRFIQKPMVSSLASKNFNMVPKLARSKSNFELTNFNKISSILQEFNNKYKNMQFSLMKYKKSMIDGFSHYTLSEVLGYLTGIKVISYKLHAELKALELNSINLENLHKLLNQQNEMKEIMNILKESYFLVQKCSLEILYDLIFKILDFNQKKETKIKAFIFLENLLSFISIEKKNEKNEEISKIFFKEAGDKLKIMFSPIWETGCFLRFEECLFLLTIINKNIKLQFHNTPQIKVLGKNEIKTFSKLNKLKK